MSDSESDSGDEGKQQEQPQQQQGQPGELQIKGLIKILPYAWISTADIACDKEVISQMGFTHIINCTEEDVDNFFDENPDITYTSFHIEDDHEADPSDHFEAVYEALTKVKNEKGRALVHCTDGKSVSPTMMIAFMMMASQRQDKHLPLVKALDFVMSKEPYIQPNRNFMNHLIALEKDLYDEVSVRLQADRGARGSGKNKHVRGKGKRGK